MGLASPSLVADHGLSIVIMSNALVPDRISPISQSFFEQSYGGMLICCMIMLVVYGLSVLQTYMYFLKYGNDGVLKKAMVLSLWVLGTTHATFVYYYLVLSYANPLLLISGVWYAVSLMKL
ncbi:hypothetical protein HETIRDRAFT_171958 [Heterobasidion irregulare TC 32-1]|uniref:Uncharacterized protein n=1 Tax=Heterobasidion irregulare (strain TC 32-1) TaxID=747525 RepID=W4K2D8_HETIT|nr:uncharacterized protein HETIRDRAFT_171958 [Heterobasidion irregulare TC 32-1]ETW79510.1 hypothetical protein HETIRDRAFT_171958 [Heterobasidion irregulare TC 32-1]